jgi:hypothetical protein
MKTLTYTSIAILAALIWRIAVSPDWQLAIGAFATAVVKPLVVPLIELINVPAFVYIVAFAIFCAAIVACAAYWIRAVRPRMRQLKAVRRGLYGLPLPHRSDARSRWPEARERLGALLRDNGLFVSAWAEFQSQSVAAGGIPNAPFGHLVASEPQQARDRGGLMASLPGYFTSVGLIFTFVGLVVALYFAAKGFRSGNMQDAREAIIRLLNAASFKFLTSVAALIGALMISLFLRLNLSIIARETLVVTELIESFLSAWREQIGVGARQEHFLTSDTLRRFEALLDGLQAVTQRLDEVLRRDDARAMGG